MALTFDQHIAEAQKAFGPLWVNSLLAHIESDKQDAYDDGYEAGSENYPDYDYDDRYQEGFDDGYDSATREDDA